MTQPEPALPLINISKLQLSHLNIPNLRIERGQCWAIVGRNGSGKQRLSQLLAGKLEGAGASLQCHYRDIRILSFEEQQKFYEKELHDDNSEFMEGQDSGTTVTELLNLKGEVPEELRFLKLEPLLERGYRLLSSGEARKTLLAQALLAKPEILILDEPFDSLDLDSRTQLITFFDALSKTKEITLVFLLNTLEDVFSWHTHIAVMDKGEMIAAAEADTLRHDTALQGLLSFDANTLPDWPAPLPATEIPELLVSLHKGAVKYGTIQIFHDVDLSIRRGEHTLLTGANGSGKSTLLALISGDHPQCYSNDLSIFGIRRGSGETIWELKKRIGIVSAALHRDHRVAGSALHIVLSGFHDSIGLYDSVSPLQIEHARHWLRLTGMEAKSAVPFKHLSYGEQRLVLIARALVKQPPLLLLDEPTQGLDSVNRLRIMYFLEHLSTQQNTTIVMASHRLDEYLPLFSQHIHLDNGKDARFGVKPSFRVAQ